MGTCLSKGLVLRRGRLSGSVCGGSGMPELDLGGDLKDNKYSYTKSK